MQADGKTTRENADIISQVLQFTEVDKTADQVNAQLQSQLLFHWGDHFLKGGFFFEKRKLKETKKEVT